MKYLTYYHRGAPNRRLLAERGDHGLPSPVNCRIRVLRHSASRQAGDAGVGCHYGSQVRAIQLSLLRRGEPGEQLEWTNKIRQLAETGSADEYEHEIIDKSCELRERKIEEISLDEAYTKLHYYRIAL